MHRALLRADPISPLWPVLSTALLGAPLPLLWAASQHPAAGPVTHFLISALVTLTLLSAVWLLVGASAWVARERAG
jgi:hypothetical protein